MTEYEAPSSFGESTDWLAIKSPTRAKTVREKHSNLTYKRYCYAFTAMQPRTLKRKSFTSPCFATSTPMYHVLLCTNELHRTPTIQSPPDPPPNPTKAHLHYYHITIYARDSAITHQHVHAVTLSDRFL